MFMLSKMSLLINPSAHADLPAGRQVNNIGICSG